MTDSSESDTAPGIDRGSRRECEGDRLRRPPVSIDASGLSHRGSVRPDNQDHFLVARAGRYLETLSTSLPAGEIPERHEEAGHVLMVADGMGGAAGGEIASRVAIGTMVDIARNLPDWIMKVDDASADEIVRRAIGFYRRVHAELSERARSEPVLAGMGTTMTVARSVGPCLFVTHVGDSRAYLHRGGTLTQLTTDHTHVQQLVDAGLLAREQAASHRLRHILTNVLGGRTPEVEVEVQRIELRDRDRILLCSDGLTEAVSDPQIADVLERTPAPEAACRALVDLALDRGAPDNVTVVIGRCSTPPPAS